MGAWQSRVYRLERGFLSAWPDVVSAAAKEQPSRTECLFQDDQVATVTDQGVCVNMVDTYSGFVFERKSCAGCTLLGISVGSCVPVGVVVPMICYTFVSYQVLDIPYSRYLVLQQYVLLHTYCCTAAVARTDNPPEMLRARVFIYEKSETSLF